MLSLDQVNKAILKSPTSMRQAAQHLNVPFGTFKYYAQKYKLYSPNQSGKGNNYPNRGNGRFSLDDILTGNIEYKAPSSLLKKRLIDAGIKQEVCEVCGQLPTWNGKKLTLQLDHIDGNHTNNKLENLRILCPNCHTQTPTHSRKINVKKHRHLKETSKTDVLNAVEQLKGEGDVNIIKIAKLLNLNPRSKSVCAFISNLILPNQSTR